VIRDGLLNENRSRRAAGASNCCPNCFDGLASRLVQYGTSRHRPVRTAETDSDSPATVDELRMRIHNGRVVHFAAAVLIVTALGAGFARGGNEAQPLVISDETPVVFDGDDWTSFSVDETELFARADEAPSRGDDNSAAADVVPSRPAVVADQAINLIPLPAPVVPALLGVAAVALRFAIRGRNRSAAGVFRRSR